MAESADRSTLTERYTAIEQSYCADQWGEVIKQGRELLDEIPRTPGLLPEGLRERVQLLMAHALLYGFSDRDGAEDLYSEVLNSKAEVALRQIAEQGLEQCNKPVQVQAAVAEPEPPAPQQELQSPAPANPPTVALAKFAEPGLAEAGLAEAASGSLATPWLEAGSAPTPWAATTVPDPDPAVAVVAVEAPVPVVQNVAVERDNPQDAILIPEVVEEPELLEVHQADPALAEELDLSELVPEPVTVSLLKDLPPTNQDLGTELVCELFRHPPAPVEEEDQELLLGLLRVLVHADSAHGGG